MTAPHDTTDDAGAADCDGCVARAIEITLLRTALEAVHSAAHTALDANTPIWRPRRG